MTSMPLHILADDAERAAAAAHTPAPGYIRMTDESGNESFIKDPLDVDPAYSCVLDDVKALGVVAIFFFALAAIILMAHGVPLESALKALF